jgi:hypothetical protein
LAIRRLEWPDRCKDRIALTLAMLSRFAIALLPCRNTEG